MLIALQKYASTRNLNDEKWYKWWSNRVDFECFHCDEHMMKFKNCKDQKQ